MVKMEMLSLPADAGLGMANDGNDQGQGVRISNRGTCGRRDF
jgi:hypothetical protein